MISSDESKDVLIDPENTIDEKWCSRALPGGRAADELFHATHATPLCMSDYLDEAGIALNSPVTIDWENTAGFAVRVVCVQIEPSWKVDINMRRAYNDVTAASNMDPGDKNEFPSTLCRLSGEVEAGCAHGNKF